MLPATRITATALDAFLNVAGFKLYGLYGRQFVKVLHYIDQVFLEDLKQVWRLPILGSRKFLGHRMLVWK